MKKKKTISTKNIIPVAIASNDNYFMPATVCMYSIVERTKSFVDFFILSDGITADHQQQMKNALKTFDNCRITFVDMTQYDLSRFPNLLHFSTSSYSRFFIPEICTQYDKVIYTDADCVFNGDIAELFAVNLENYGLAATVEEIGASRKEVFNHQLRKKIFSIDQSHLYFQSGNMIINCAYWRKHDITAKLVDKAIQYHDKLVAADLDAFNMVFANNYKKLHFKYGATVHRYNHTQGNQEMIEGFKNPVVIHYSGDIKPWNTSNVLFYQEYHDVYVKVMREIRKNTLVHSKILYKLFGFVPLFAVEEIK